MNHYTQNNASEALKSSRGYPTIGKQIKPSHGPYIRFKRYSREGLSGILAGVVIFLPALCVILYNSY